MPTSYPDQSFKLYKTSQIGVAGPIFDLELGDDGGPKLVEGATELGQAVELRLRTNLGEFWEDRFCGLPWRDKLLGMKPANRNIFRIELLLALRREPRVVQIDSLTLEENLVTRHLSARIYVKTRDGTKIAVGV